MNDSEILSAPHIIDHCYSCGEALYDGSTAYSLIGKLFCHACVTSSLKVCRTYEEDAYTAPHFESKPTVLDGITHREICPKTAVNGINLPQTAKSERMTHID